MTAWVLALLLTWPGACEQTAAPVPDSAIRAYVQVSPEDARADLFRQIRGMAPPPVTGERVVPDSISSVAQAFAVVWSDSFPLSVVRRYRCWEPGRWRLKLRGDSLRLAGNATFARHGPEAAIRVWRSSAGTAERARDTAGLASTLGNIGAAFAAVGRLDSATRYLQWSRELAATQDDRLTVANAVGAMAGVAREQGDFVRARALYEDATTLRRGVGDGRGMAADLNNLGLVVEALGDVEGAEQLYRQALEANAQGGRKGPRAANLLNLANLASVNGDYARAGRWYDEARAIRETLGEPFELAVVLHNSGLLAERRGDYSKAIGSLSEAAELYEETGAEADAVRARLALVNVLRSAGRPQAAIDQLKAVERLIESAQLTPSVEGELAVARAEVAMMLNNLREAERSYSQAIALFRAAGDRRGQALAEEGLGLWYLHQERASKALPWLQRALGTRRTLPDPRAVAMARVLLGYGYQATGAIDQARAQFSMALTAIARIRDPVAEASALESLASLEYQLGRSGRAESLYTRALARVGDRPLPDLVWRLHLGRGKALEYMGAAAEARTAYRAAIAEIERLSGSLLVPDRRAALRADKWEAYGRLALLELAEGRSDSVLALSERMRARELLDQLALGRVQPSGVDRELVAREQDLRRRIAELEAGASAGAVSGGRDMPGAVKRQSELRSARDAYARTLVEMREASPAYTGMVAGETVSRDTVLRHLAPGDLVLEYLLLDSTSLVLAATSDTVEAFDLGVPRRNLAGLIDFARMVVGRDPARDSAHAWQAPLRRLYRELLAPVEQAGLLADARRLIIVPHAELHYLPFAALLGGEPAERFLAERFSITYAPSATVWVRLVNRAKPLRTSAFAFAPAPRRLPGSRIEVDALRTLYPRTASVWIGSQATESLLRELAPQAGVLHLAGYGVLNPSNPLFSYVELAADSAQDGRLEVHEVYGLEVSGLVVLSACETALGAAAGGGVPAGDDWVGLVGAFLYAGASGVLATQWRIDDRATADLMRSFYGHLQRREAPAEALALAQRSALLNASTQHPYYWAGFTLSGAATP
jgi:CHAT domain-containing protein/Tfp pilus assembly protein PilF